MQQTYKFKDLAELIPFEPTEPPLLGIWDCYGGRLIRYVVNQDGLWLCKQGRGFDERTDGRLTGLSKHDIAEKQIEGFGTVYGTKDGKPLLPTPFTAHELLIFNARHGSLISQINEQISGEFEREWLAELTERNPDAADLAATILYGDLPMDAEIYPDGDAQSQDAKPAMVSDGEWVTQAQTRAREIVKESRECDRYPSQENIGDTIAAEFRKAGIVGSDGKPLSGATIKRHALKGISSASGKQLSTTIGWGK